MTHDRLWWTWRLRTVRAVLPVLAALGLAPALTRAHDSPLPSATLVQRDGGHLTLTLHLDPARVLHRTLQPQLAPAESLAQLSAMEPARFASLWEQATQRWAQGCELLLPGRSAAAQRWTWPPARDVQAHLQRQLMPQLTGGHAEHVLLTAQAEWRMVPQAAAKTQLKLHTALRPLSLTLLRPRQQWVAEGQEPIDLPFR